MELDLDFKHNRGTGYEPCKFHEGHNKGAAIYVGKYYDRAQYFVLRLHTMAE